MDATVSVLRRSELNTETTRKAPETRVLTVKAVYILSEAGRKALLLEGGNGRAEQALEIKVPHNRLHLVSVDNDGNAQLKLCPRYDVRPDGRVVQIKTPPVYDRPPSLDELFLAAAKTHELESSFAAQRSQRGQRSETQQDVRTQIAQAFLADSARRAAVHPAPSQRRCYLVDGDRRLLFDADRDQGPARQVPAEAHRRFRADERARRERNLQEHARRQSVHEEKKRFLAEWVDRNGDADLKERQAAGMLPMAEAIEAIADAAFLPLRDWPVYVRNGPELLQAYLRRFPKYADVVVTESELQVVDGNASDATAAQWAQLKEAQTRLPGAIVTIRSHRLIWKHDAKAPSLSVRGLLVVQHVGPVVVRREFAVSDAVPAKKTYS